MNFIRANAWMPTFSTITFEGTIFLVHLLFFRVKLNEKYMRVTTSLPPHRKNTLFYLAQEIACG